MIDYPFGEALPDPGTAMEIADGVRWIRMPLPYALNHINLALAEDGNGKWCAIDTGLAMGDVQTHWQTLINQYPLSRMIVTHYHPDHLGLAGWLHEKTGVPLWMTQGEYLTAQAFANEIANYSVAATGAFFRRHGLNETALKALADRGNAYGRAVGKIPAEYRKYVAGEKIRIGKHDWLVIIGRGHAPEHASLYCAELGVMIGGDMMLPSISTNVAVFAPNPDEDSLTEFLDSIRQFLDLPADTLVLPAHGRPFRGMHARVAALTQHHAERCAELVIACRAAPQTAAALLPVLFKRELNDPHQIFFAMSEAIAHLNYLQQRGELNVADEGGVLHYRAV